MYLYVFLAAFCVLSYGLKAFYWRTNLLSLGYEINKIHYLAGFLGLFTIEFVPLFTVCYFRSDWGIENVLMGPVIIAIMMSSFFLQLGCREFLFSKVFPTGTVKRD